jgi:acetate kinase
MRKANLLIERELTLSCMNAVILSINGGSSSIRFSLFKKEKQPVLIYAGNIKRIGLDDAVLSVRDLSIGNEQVTPVTAKNYEQAITHLVGLFGQNQKFVITAIGHRIVYGLDHFNPVLITDSLIAELEKNIFIDPDHLPAELMLVRALKKIYPQVPQVACFDTSFHAGMPQRASRFALPRHYFTSGLRRFGFHGISYSYLMQKLGEEKNVNLNGKIILAHLGSGASIVAVKNKESIDTSMGFSPAGGFLMGTRSGDMDPGLISFILKNESLNPEQFSSLVNHQSGLLGISETSSDMQDLLDREKSDERAAEAIEIFCYQVKKWIGSFTAALGGLDTLVFSGGIGENAPAVRSRICEGLQYLGIELDDDLNNKSEKIISAQNRKLDVYVIPTDEELMIAKMVSEILSIN